MMSPDAGRRLAGEALGTAMLLATVVGSGIMGERLAGGNVAIALLANTLATGAILVVSEVVATFGLLSVISGCTRRTPDAVPWAVGAYITAAYWFTASTSFANPAVTIARAASNTFAGIRPADVPVFVAAQCVGAALATAFFGWLVPGLPAGAEEPR